MTGKNKIEVAASLLVVAGISVYVLWQFIPPSFYYDYEWRPPSGIECLVSTPLKAVATLSFLVLVVSWGVAALVMRLSPRFSFAIAFLVGGLLSLGGVSASCGVLGDRTPQKNFESLMVLAGREDWIGIGRYNQKYPATTPLERNLVSLAYAELDVLFEHYRRQSNRDIHDLISLEIPDSYVSAMLSDIYWSMGEISMSQMYAFQALEKMDNRSPRLLRRLVQTNIVYGYYEVASKYLLLLRHLGYDDAFVARYSLLLSDEASNADPLLHSKRLCVPVENGFPSTRSLPYDLQRILKQNPDHRTSTQYLRSIQLL